jgi:hypothetical protein
MASAARFESILQSIVLHINFSQSKLIDLRVDILCIQQSETVKRRNNGENKRRERTITRTWRDQASGLIDMTLLAPRVSLHINPHWKASRKALMISGGETKRFESCANHR